MPPSNESLMVLPGHGVSLTVAPTDAAATTMPPRSGPVALKTPMWPGDGVARDGPAGDVAARVVGGVDDPARSVVARDRVVADVVIGRVDRSVRSGVRRARVDRTIVVDEDAPATVVLDGVVIDRSSWSRRRGRCRRTIRWWGSG